MKNTLFMTAICLLCASCTLNTDNDINNDYVLTTEEKSVYNTILETELQSLGWSYDPNEIRFGEGFLPNETDENYELFKKVSDKMSYNTKSWDSSEKIATAAVTIFHPNGDLGGSARFYFKNNLITCGYYIYNDKIYSLDTEGVFLNGKSLDIYENPDFSLSEYTESEISVPFNAFTDISPGSGMAAVIENNSLNFYMMHTGAFVLSKSYSQADLGYIPYDAAFDSDGSCAVLAGVPGENGSFVSKKIIFLDNLLNPTGKDFELYNGNFTGILFENGSIILSNKTAVSEFDAKTHQNTENHQLVHFVRGITSCDIYNNGTKLYALTDNTNVYLYTSDFTLLWRTYYNDNKMSRYMYFADLNQDGIKELYITEPEEMTTAKYIITESGFERSDDVDVYALYLPGDFDCDNRAEYIYLSGSEKKYFDR